MTVSVTQAEAQLKVALASEAKQKRENAKAEIQRLSAEGATLQAELFALAAQIKQAQADRLQLHGALVNARTQLIAYSQPLDPLTFPSAKDERERVRQLAAWQQRQRELLAQHTAACERESVRGHAVQLKRKLEHLQYEIQNQTALAEGRKPGQLAEGGVFTGVEDFLSGSQYGPPRRM